MSRHGSYDFAQMYGGRSCYAETGKFGRIFSNLAPFADDTAAVRAALMDLGAAGGPMDPRDQVTDPVDSVLNPGPANPDSPSSRMTAGMTFLGQFIDHDITFDPTSSLERQADPAAVTNFRTAALELDSVYGAGPGASPHLYDQSVDGGATTLLVEPNPNAAALSRGGAPRFDLPRNSQGVPLIGDPRNDENVVVSQLQLAFLRFHNAMVAKLRSEQPGLTPRRLFAEAQRLTRWHYQWIVLHEFLPATIGRGKTRFILRQGLKCVHWKGRHPFIPVEFAVAAYRFGHSQVRPSYRVNFGPAAGQELFLFFFDGTLPAGQPDPEDMRGGVRAGRRFVDWQTFFDFGDGNVRRNKRIDARLSSVLFNLPGTPPGEPASLAQRNLLRHLTFGLPSGQAVARALGAPELAPGDLAALKPLGLDRSAPLWWYVLKEAEVFRGGARLGPVGGRIVGDVLIGLLLGDPMSFLNVHPGWKPEGDHFRMTDLLKTAGVVPPL